MLTVLELTGPSSKEKKENPLTNKRGSVNVVLYIVKRSNEMECGNWFNIFANI